MSYYPKYCAHVNVVNVIFLFCRSHYFMLCVTCRVRAGSDSVCVRQPEAWPGLFDSFMMSSKSIAPPSLQPQRTNYRRYHVFCCLLDLFCLFDITYWKISGPSEALAPIVMVGY